MVTIVSRNTVIMLHVGMALCCFARLSLWLLLCAQCVCSVTTLLLKVCITMVQIDIKHVPSCSQAVYHVMVTCDNHMSCIAYDSKFGLKNERRSCCVLQEHLSSRQADNATAAVQHPRLRQVTCLL